MIDTQTTNINLSTEDLDLFVPYLNEIVGIETTKGKRFAAMLVRIEHNKLWFKNRAGLLTCHLKDSISSIRIIKPRTEVA